MAEIWMVFGAEEYKYGTYRFVTRAEKKQSKRSRNADPRRTRV